MNMHNSIPSDAPRQNQPFFSNADDDAQIDIKNILYTLLRRRWIILNTAIFFTVLAVLVVFQLTPRYTAKAVLALETRQSQVVDLQAVMSGLQADSAAIKTEIDVMQSRHLIGRVVDELGLVKDPEFNGALQTEKGLGYYLNPFNLIPDYLHEAILGKKKEVISEEEEAARQHAAVIDSVLDKLSVQNAVRSYTISIAFESTDPKKAARIANGLAEIYLTDQLEAKFDATQRASEWLNTRIYNLRERVREAETAAQQYREKHQLISTGNTGFVADQQLTQLNGDLVEARTELARVQAKYNQVKKLADKKVAADTLGEGLDSKLIESLREKQSELLRKRAELATRYGPKHPTMMNVEAEIADTISSIAVEARKVINNISADVEVAKARVEALEENLEGLKAKSFELNRAQVKLRELEREATANRVLLETFLARFKETSSQADLQQADARIISKADVPIYPSYPKKKLIILLVAFAAVGVGVGLALMLEAIDDGVHTFDQLKNILGIKGVGMIPLLDTAKLKNTSPEDYLVKKPTSSFAEAHRNIHASLLYSGVRQSTPKVVMFTSSVPGEGKSTLALCYARLMSKSGKKVLLLEADLRRPVMKKRLNVADMPNTLTTLLEGQSKDNDQIIHRDDDTGLHVLAADSHGDPQRLIESKVFSQLISWARETYDVVVIDSPPVMVVSDAVLLAHHADTTLYAIQWGSTPKKSARDGIEMLRAAGAHVTGAIITQVNVKKHQSYGYTDHGYYYGYGSKSGYYKN